MQKNMKKIILFFVVLFVVIGSSYGFAQWSLAKSNSKVVKSDNQKNPILKEEKSNYQKSALLTEEQVKKGMKEEGYKNEQIYALDHSEITKPEYSSFPSFVHSMAMNFNKDDINNYPARLAASYGYAKYFMERTNDSAVKNDALKVKEQTKQVILNKSDKKEIQKLRELFNRLNEKYN